LIAVVARDIELILNLTLELNWKQVDAWSTKVRR
jgi:hypothetical protein